MEKIIIAAMAINRTIGHNNALPWHIPEELKLFKKVTMGYPMIMGRKTFDSLPGILPGRRHIVLTRNRDFSAAGAECVASLEEAITLLERDDCERTFIIGGAQIFAESLAVTDSIRMTLINREVEGDVFFPPFEENFVEVSREEFSGRENFTVVEYRRKGKSKEGS
jgi:dihydrofolate reductase